MRRRSPQQRGRDFEESWSRRHGARQTPGSGATPRYKLDTGIDELELLVECKSTEAASYRLEAAEILKMEAGARGPGSRMVVPAMVVDIAGAGGDVLVLRTADLFDLLERARALGAAGHGVAGAVGSDALARRRAAAG